MAPPPGMLRPARSDKTRVATGPRRIIGRRRRGDRKPTRRKAKDQPDSRRLIGAVPRQHNRSSRQAPPPVP